MISFLILNASDCSDFLSLFNEISVNVLKTSKNLIFIALVEFIFDDHLVGLNFCLNFLVNSPVNCAKTSHLLYACTNCRHLLLILITKKLSIFLQPETVYSYSKWYIIVS